MECRFASVQGDGNRNWPRQRTKSLQHWMVNHFEGISVDSPTLTTVDVTMNKRQLMALGVPEECVPEAVACITRGASSGAFADAKPEEKIRAVIANPAAFQTDKTFGTLAR